MRVTVSGRGDDGTPDGGEQDGLVSTTIAFRYGVFRPLLVALGMGPSLADVALGSDHIEVRMGWGFRARVPRGSVRSVYRDRDMRGAIGVHGWRGRWLVNGAVSGIVTIEIDPPVRAWVVGFPIRLRILHVSLEDPEGLLAAWDAYPHSA